MEKNNVNLEKLNIFIKSWLERASKEDELVKTFRKNVIHASTK